MEAKNGKCWNVQRLFVLGVTGRILTLRTKNRSALDLRSTSQTKRTRDFDFAPPVRCIYSTPYIAYQLEGKDYAVTQANCHHWDCPRCGIGRAKTEYWRIVNGCAEIVQQGHTLNFITITTRGAGLSVKEAEQKYLLWTNRFLANLRGKTARAGGYWCYVQVTERQKRAHPHSHILTTFEPNDVVEGVKEHWITKRAGIGEVEYVDAMRSEYLQRAVCEAGLGEQYDYSKVRSEKAVARYVGKYLFKSSLLTVWPKGWKRVRYSQNWPREKIKTTDGFVLLSWRDWETLAKKAVWITCQTEEVFDYVSWKLRQSDTIVTKRKRQSV